jgi:hypothetical protein
MKLLLLKKESQSVGQFKMKLTVGLITLISLIPEIDNTT